MSYDTYDSVNHIEIIPDLKNPKKQDLIVTVGNKSQIKVWSWNMEMNKKATIIKKIQIQDFSFVSCFKTINVEKFLFGRYLRKNYLITGLENGRFQVWDWRKKNPLVLNILDEDFSAVRSVLCIKQYYKSFQSFIKINNFYFFYVVGFSNGNIKFYNNKGKMIKNITKAHEGEISALESLELSRNPNGGAFCKEYSEIVISGGTDKFIKFWKWRSGDILRVLNCEQKILYNCLVVMNVFDDIEKKEKYILVSGGRKTNDICQISIWKY